MKPPYEEPGQECARAWETMPWALQGRAEPERRERMLAHLSQCNACSEEFALQTRLHAAMSLPSDLPIDAEAGLQRLLAQLDAPAPAAAPRSRSGWVLKALAASVLIQAIGLGVLSSRLYSADQRAQQASYRTLSDAAAGAAAGAVRIVPDPRMPLADWNTLLRSLQLRVVEGPNGVGAYLVAPTTDADDASARTERIVQRLRSAPGIRMAEPIAAP